MTDLPPSHHNLPPGVTPGDIDRAATGPAAEEYEYRVTVGVEFGRPVDVDETAEKALTRVGIESDALTWEVEGRPELRIIAAVRDVVVRAESDCAAMCAAEDVMRNAICACGYECYDATASEVKRA